jgi:hypothetical protein
MSKWLAYEIAIVDEPTPNGLTTTLDLTHHHKFDMSHSFGVS